FRMPEGHESHVSIEKTLACAEAAGGKDHHFKVIQLPFNFGLPEALSHLSQESGDATVSALDAARTAGLTVFTSVPLMQGQLLGRFGPDFKPKFPGLKTDAQRCLQFARSTPGVTAPLCGMKDVAHVEENSALCASAPFSVEEFDALIGRS